EVLEVLVVGAEQRFDPLFRDDEALHLAQFWVFKCSSRNCFGSTVEGDPAMRSTALAVLGNAITSRIDDSPASRATMRSSPSAIPPCGGVPYWSASRKKPKRSFASSSLIPSRWKIRACSAAS